MFLHLTFNASLYPDESELLLDVILADRFGWTLDYIGSLPKPKKHLINETITAYDQAVNHIRKRNHKK